MSPWRLLIHGAASPAHNMAIDEALLREIHEPVLRLYEWNVPAVSLGYFQPATLALAGRPFVRRYTGGGLVDHEADITYTVVLPRAHPWMELSAPASYELIHRGVRSALAAAGIESDLAAAPGNELSEACFKKPVRYDVMAQGQKLSGAAQRRTREGMLHQGSILLADPRLNGEVRRQFAKAFAANLELNLKPGELTKAETARATDLERERYETETWNKMR